MLPEDRALLISTLVEKGDVSALCDAGAALEPPLGSIELVALIVAIKLQRQKPCEPSSRENPVTHIQLQQLGC